MVTEQTIDRQVRELSDYYFHRGLAYGVLRDLFARFGDRGITLAQFRKACCTLPELAMVHEGYFQLMIRDVWSQYRRSTRRRMQGAATPAHVSMWDGAHVIKYDMDRAPLVALQSHREMQKYTSDAASAAASVSAQWIAGILEIEGKENGQD